MVKKLMRLDVAFRSYSKLNILAVHVHAWVHYIKGRRYIHLITKIKLLISQPCMTGLFSLINLFSRQNLHYNESNEIYIKYTVHLHGPAPTLWIGMHLHVQSPAYVYMYYECKS